MRCLLLLYIINAPAIHEMLLVPNEPTEDQICLDWHIIKANKKSLQIYPFVDPSISEDVRRRADVNLYRIRINEALRGVVCLCEQMRMYIDSAWRTGMFSLIYDSIKIEDCRLRYTYGVNALVTFLRFVEGLVYVKTKQDQTLFEQSGLSMFLQKLHTLKSTETAWTNLEVESLHHAEWTVHRLHVLSTFITT